MVVSLTSDSRHPDPWRTNIGSAVLNTVIVGAVQESVVELETGHFDEKVKS